MNGYQNEFDFVLYLNGKKIKELNPIMKDLVQELYGNISEESTIKSWKNHYKQKTDIFIKINNIMKGISIKEGSKNSVHVEPISSFIHFLIDNKVPKNIIEEYLKYHYADGTTNGSGNIRLSVSEYKKENQDKIDLINKYLNDEVLLIKAINRFVLQGNNYKFEIDALIYGTVNDFMWISKNQIIKVLLSSKNIYSTGVHFGNLFCQPQSRNINNNELYDKKRYCVQIKWYELFEDIIRVKAKLI